MLLWNSKLFYGHLISSWLILWFPKEVIFHNNPLCVYTFVWNFDVQSCFPHKGRPFLSSLIERGHNFVWTTNSEIWLWECLNCLWMAEMDLASIMNAWVPKILKIDPCNWHFQQISWIFSKSCCNFYHFLCKIKALKILKLDNYNPLFQKI